jgi:hypothetical protein
MIPVDFAEGERRKTHALSTLAARRALYVLRGRRALIGELFEHGEATIDAARRKVPIPDEVSPKLFGAVPGELARAAIIARAGFAQTTRPEAHARPLSVWRLIDRAAALDWLAAHPDGVDAA